MNDRYLFKAKRIDNGEWVQGYLYGIWEKRYILWGMTNDVPNMIEVDPATICQCTGLKDKNGRLIWENDIVNCKKYIGGNYVDYCIEAGYVEMKYGAFGLHRIKYDAYYRTFKDWLEDYEYEVIGNIFDNPELLEGERC